MKCIRTIFAALIAVILISGFALAALVANNTTQLYVKSDKLYQSGIYISEGEPLKYLDKIVDESGSEWYEVQYGSISGWIRAYSVDHLEVEVKDYFGSNLVDAAEALGLEDYTALDADLKHKYSNDSMIILGNDNVDYMKIKSDAYSLYGIFVGMKADEAKKILLDEKMKLVNEGSRGISFDKPTGKWFNRRYESCIILNLDEGKVSSIEWSIYAD